MTGSIAVVLGFGPEEVAIEALILTNGVNFFGPARQHFVDISLVGDVEEELIDGRIENLVKGDAEFDDTEVGSKVAARV